MTSQEISKVYGNKLRVRVCGVLIEDDSILLVKHRGIGANGELLIPPGGGMEFGSSAEENLKREFKEETGLSIKVCDFLFISEFLDSELHAIELFFKVEHVSGSIAIGIDPEMSTEDQIINDVKMIKFSELLKMDQQCLHGMLRGHRTGLDLLNTRGFFKFENYI
ncbi:MAG: NUDIX hydrolase [Cyclobacteriaceae bacterium]